MPKLNELVREEGNRYSNSRNVPAMETLDSELNQLVNYCNNLNNYAASIEQSGARINPGDNKKVLVSNDGLKWEKLTDDYVQTISGNKIIDNTLPLSKLSGISANKVLVSDDENKLICSLITSKYLDDSVITAAKLAANSVITEKINNAAVTVDKLAANAVTADKIADNAVTADKIAEEVAAKIEKILDLPKIAIITANGNERYQLDQSYKQHVIILPAIYAYTVNYTFNVYVNDIENPAAFNCNSDWGTRVQGRGFSLILKDTNTKKVEFMHTLPGLQEFIDIKLGKVYE